MNILVLHGPNLNLLGEREPAIYGTATLEDINDSLRQIAAQSGAAITCVQSNHEGVLIDTLHAERKWLDGLIFNPGAFTHYAYALRDAVAALQKPMIEVHLSDPLQREGFRHVSVFEGLPMVERISGKGAEGYREALRRLLG
jgi:3-dehydroquinate dehydratase II